MGQKQTKSIEFPLETFKIRPHWLADELNFLHIDFHGLSNYLIWRLVYTALAAGMGEEINGFYSTNYGEIQLSFTLQSPLSTAQARIVGSAQ